MAPSPRVKVEKDICSLLAPQSNNEEVEEDDMDGAFDVETQGAQYYESTKILGALFRAIDERNFLDDLQRQADSSKASVRRNPHPSLAGPRAVAGKGDAEVALERFPSAGARDQRDVSVLDCTGPPYA